MRTPSDHVMFPQINDIWIEHFYVIFIIYFYYCTLFLNNVLHSFLLFLYSNFAFIIITLFLFNAGYLDPNLTK